MHYLLFGRKPALARWQSRDFWPGSEAGPDARCRQDEYEKQVGVESPGAPETDGVHRRVATEIMAYRIFPPRIVSAVLARQPLELGDTVGIVYRFVPGLRLFFAARVVETFDEQSGSLWRTGFTYRTLVGHPEYGAETFCVEKNTETGQVIVALRSWSRPGTWLAKLSSPFVRRMQVSATNAALAHLSGHG